MLPNTKMRRTPIEYFSSLDSESVIDLELPQDLITEILLYLPVKSLTKFKCVSKPWLSLISSSQFIKSHFAKSSREGQYSNHQLLFTTHASKCGMKHCSLSAALHEPSTQVCDIEYPSQKNNEFRWIVGIVNGFVCLASWENKLCRWNPSLRKCKHLPSSNFSVNGCTYVAYGFGYNESNDDYKVVIASSVKCRVGDYETWVKVYSVRTDSWRRTEYIKGGVPIGNGTYVNGKIWWTARRMRKWKMVSLDMVSDKYEEFQGPVHSADAYNWVVTVLGGRLYVLCDYCKMKADLWVMNKFGVDESWSKVVSVDIYPAKLRGMIQLLCISRNGEIVFVDRLGGLVLYRSKDKEFKKIQLGDLKSASQVFVYVESLVSPNGL